MRTLLRTAAVASAAILFLVGCSTGSSESTWELSEAGDAASDDDGYAGEAPAAEGEAGADLDLGNVAQDRQVITTGSVTMSAEDPQLAAQRISAYVDSLGGWVEEREERAGSDTVEAYARIVIRIPSQSVSAALDRLADHGTIEDVTINRSDVTLQVRDVAARIRALEMSISRMEALLARAENTNDLVQAEQMLTERQSELESLLSQQAYLADQVSMSTVTVSVFEPDAVPEEPEDPPSGFWGGLVTGWNAFVEFLDTSSLVIGVLLPWLVFLAIITAIVVWLVRATRRRRAARRPAYPAGPMTAMPPHPGMAPPPAHAQAPAPAPAPQAPPAPAPGPQPPAPTGPTPETHDTQE